MSYHHVPVLLSEVIEYLNPRVGGFYVDGTLGGAGYTLEIAKRLEGKGQVHSFDLDESAIENAQKLIQEKKINNIDLHNDNYRYFKKYISEGNDQSEAKKVDGFVLDLGLSSAQLEDRGRGFSFLVDAPLEMSFSNQSSVNSKQTTVIVNSCKPDKLEEIIKDYGEERYAKLIVKGIVNYRKKKKIESTFELVEIIEKSVPGSYKNNKKIHFATKTFQALRIATNDELGSLQDALEDTVTVMRPGGRIVIVSFHSLEDRIVKQFFKKESKDCLCPPELPDCRCGHKAKLKIITKKPVVAREEEVKKNPRARSAKLRAAEII